MEDAGPEAFVRGDERTQVRRAHGLEDHVDLHGVTRPCMTPLKTLAVPRVMISASAQVSLE